MLNAASGARIVPYPYAPAVSSAVSPAVSVRRTGCTILKQVPSPGAETTEVDGGFISAPTDVDDVYYAVSTTYQDVTYEFTLFDTDSIVWGGENDYYERLE